MEKKGLEGRLKFQIEVDFHRSPNYLEEQRTLRDRGMVKGAKSDPHRNLAYPKECRTLQRTGRSEGLLQEAKN